MFFWIEAIRGELHFYARTETEFKNFGSGTPGLTKATEYILSARTAVAVDHGLFVARIIKRAAEIKHVLGERWIVVEILSKNDQNSTPYVAMTVADPEFSPLLPPKSKIDEVIAYLKLPPAARTEGGEAEDKSTTRTSLLRLGRTGL